jgi:hypothetical protein
MRLGRLRRAWVTPLGLVIALVGLVGFTPGHAAASSLGVPVPYVLSTRLHLTHGVGQMVYARGHLFVSAGPGGSDVYVYSTAGKLLSDITDEPGAWSMVVSADGDTVFVANYEGSTISAIDASTFAHTEYDVNACPTSLALAAGRLFYSWGCQVGQFTSGISSIDPSTGGDPMPTSVTNSYQPSVLAGGGDTLAEITQGEIPAEVHAYSASDTGVLTPGAAVSLDNFGPSELAVSADGSTIVVPGATSYGLTEYSAATMHAKAHLRAPSGAAAVALSPDGVHLVGGLGGRALVALYSNASTLPVWQRVGVTTAPSTWAKGAAAQVAPGAITFSTDGSHIYALVIVNGQTEPRLFASGVTTTKTRLHLSVKSSTPAHPVSVSVKLSVPGKVVFDDRVAGKTIVLRTMAVNSKGQAKFTFRSPFDGVISAQYLGTTSLDPSLAEKAFTVRSKAHVSLTGSYATQGAVKLFHSYKQVHLLAAVSPAVLDRTVTVALQVHAKGKWHVVDHEKLLLNKHGQVKVRLGPSLTNTQFRVEETFRGDKLNPGSQAFSPTFELT